VEGIETGERTMTKVIRTSMFETNSSSTHSISIQRLPVNSKQSKLVVKDGVCNIYGGEFGWGLHRYTSAEAKASYLMTHIMGGLGEKSSPLEIRKAENTSKAKMLKEVIMTETGATQVNFCKEENGFWDYGYIDHQSDGVAEEAFTSEKTMRDFIFNPKSILVIDNDNH
jgi:hypothetical protein